MVALRWQRSRLQSTVHAVLLLSSSMAALVRSTHPPDVGDDDDATTATTVLQRPALLGAPPPGSVKVTTPLATFTDVADAQDVVGLLQGRGSTVAEVPGGLQGPGSNDSLTLFAGVLADGTFELYMLEGPPGANNRTIQRYTSTDLIHYAAAAAPALPPGEISSASMAKDNTTGEFLMVVYRPRYQTIVNTSVCGVPANSSNTSGSTPHNMQCGGQAVGCDISCLHTHFECVRNRTTGVEQAVCACSSCNYTEVAPITDGHAAYVFKSANGQAWKPSVVSGAPSWVGYPSSGLLHHPTLGWIDWHVDLEPLSAPGKMFPDDLGRTARRVIAIRTSTDGATWLNASTDGRPSGTLAPDPRRDPPEMEFAGLVPFWYGDRLAAVVTNYAPSPMVTNPAVIASASTSAHAARQPSGAVMGPYMQQEWWVHSTNLSTLVTNVSSYSDGSAGDGWRRPYLEQTKWAGCTALGISPGGAAAPPGFLLTHAPVALPGIKNVVPPDAMMWLHGGKWMGIMLWRMGGLTAPANGAFTTRPFTMPPGNYFWINYDNRAGVGAVEFDGEQTKCSATDGYMRCQNYVMVSLLPATNDAGNWTAIPGYEAEKCVTQSLSQEGISLSWKQGNGTKVSPEPLVGQSVRARVYLRAATIYSIGMGQTWGNQIM